MSLTGKTAVVTGSTSGIGLAIAEALARDGANVVMNGLGTQKENDSGNRAGRSRWHARRFRWRQHAASQPDRRDDRAGGARLRRDRHPGQQRRYSARRAGRGIRHREWDAIIAINLIGSLHRDPGRGAGGMKSRERGPHHQHVLGAFAGGLALQVGVCRRQAWSRRPDQGGGLGACGVTHHGQRHLAGLGAHAAGRGPDPGSRASQGISLDEAKRTLLARQPSQTFVLPEQVGALAAFLASDAAASITGANYRIDGGWTAQ